MYLSPPAGVEVDDAFVRLHGYTPNYATAFAFRPDVYDIWRALSGAVKAGLDPRRYELVTVATALRLRCSYCALAHGEVLRDRFHDTATVVRIATDPGHAGLSTVDTTVIDFAAKAARDAAGITVADIDALRAQGLTDDDIFHVALAVAARCFFSTLLDSLGVAPDARLRRLEPDLRQALTIGRPIADEP
jgi:uncharacterized peroxidase-related enzyme